MVKRFFTFIIFVGSALSSFAQDSTLLKMIDDSLMTGANADVVKSTFKATHIVNTPTIESPERKGLQFLIMHRFGKVNEGSYALFGLDNATIRFGLDYGIDDRFSIGVGRSSFDKTYDGSFKWKLLQQTRGRMPLSVSLYGLVAHTTLRYTDKPYIKGKYRTAYQSSLLIAKKISSNLSLQLTPSWIHFNLVPTTRDTNDMLSLGLGGRMKISKRVSINAEYNYLPSDAVVSMDTHNSLSFGLDIETGGHVFQLIFSNSEGMVGPAYIAKTPGEWGDGDIFFGFNISRAFNLKKNR